MDLIHFSYLSTFLPSNLFLSLSSTSCLLYHRRFHNRLYFRLHRRPRSSGLARHQEAHSRVTWRCVAWREVQPTRGSGFRVRWKLRPRRITNCGCIHYYYCIGRVTRVPEAPEPLFFFAKTRLPSDARELDWITRAYNEWRTNCSSHDPARVSRQFFSVKCLKWGRNLFSFKARG